MRNIKLTISYDGTRYKGWQVQKNAGSVQEEIEKAIKKVFKKKTVLYGSGRTDAGVHARGQVANFKTVSNIPVERITPALNAVLPPDIAILKAKEVPQDFHSQYDAREKTYSYSIFNSRNRDPFKENYSWRVGYRLDLELMRREARVLVGRHDFKCFQASDKKERNPVRVIKSVTIKKKAWDITISVKGNGFLYNMVRNIVGTLVDIGRGYLSAGSMKKILDQKDRTKAGPTAPAKGLCLMEVRY